MLVKTATITSDVVMAAGRRSSDCEMKRVVLLKLSLFV